MLEYAIAPQELEYNKQNLKSGFHISKFLQFHTKYVNFNINYFSKVCNNHSVMATEFILMQCICLISLEKHTQNP